MGRVSLHLYGSSIFYRDEYAAGVGAVMGARGMDYALHGKNYFTTEVPRHREIQLKVAG
jgi:hypothetical protein